MKNKLIKDMRIERGLTQEDMAEKLGISNVAYHLYETGKRNIPQDKAEKIAHIFEMKISDIFLPSTFSTR